MMCCCKMEFFFWWLDAHHKMCGSLSECKAKTLIIKTQRRLVVPTSVILYISHFVKSFSIYLCPAHRVPSYLSLYALIVSSRSNRNGEGERENQRRSKEAGPKRRTFILHLPHPPSAGYMSHRGAFFFPQPASCWCSSSTGRQVLLSFNTVHNVFFSLFSKLPEYLEAVNTEWFHDGSSTKGKWSQRFLSVKRKQEVVSWQLSHTNMSTSPVRHEIIIVPTQKNSVAASFIAFQVAIVISVVTDKTAINFRSGALLSTINSPKRSKRNRSGAGEASRSFHQQC